MASRAKVLANRRNAARSTGPWTAEGKSRSAQNARRYGFARPLIDIALQSEAAERLARAIAGPDPDPDRLYLARVVAAAQYQLRLIADARIGLLKRTVYRMPVTNGSFEQQVSAAVLKCLPQLRRLDRYEQQALSHRRRAIRLLCI